MPTSTLMIFDPQLAASACALGVLGIVDSSRVKGPLRGAIAPYPNRRLPEAVVCSTAHFCR
jgi:hypothetical protein